MSKVHSIQLLRGIASFLVLLVHALNKEGSHGEGYFENFVFGHIGVDIFFIISGFVMLYTINSHKSAGEFLIKRAIRILPVYWVTLALVIGVYFTFPHLVNGGRESSVFGSIFLIPTDALFLNQNAWTLTYEFIFYFGFASVFFFNSSYRVFGVVLIMLMPVVIGQICSFELPLMQYATSTLLLEFVYGFLLYYFYVNFSLSLKITLITILVFIVLLLQVLEVPNEYRMIYLGIPALLICSIFVLNEKIIARFIQKFSDFWGNISYSLYLVHPMSLAATAIVLKSIGLTEPFVFISILLVVSVILGWVVYNYVERPLTRNSYQLYARYLKK